MAPAPQHANRRNSPALILGTTDDHGADMLACRRNPSLVQVAEMLEPSIRSSQTKWRAPGRARDRRRAGRRSRAVSDRQSPGRSRHSGLVETRKDRRPTQPPAPRRCVSTLQLLPTGWIRRARPGLLSPASRNWPYGTSFRRSSNPQVAGSNPAGGAEIPAHCHVCGLGPFASIARTSILQRAKRGRSRSRRPTRTDRIGDDRPDIPLDLRAFRRHGTGRRRRRDPRRRAHGVACRVCVRASAPAP